MCCCGVVLSMIVRFRDALFVCLFVLCDSKCFSSRCLKRSSISKGVALSIVGVPNGSFDGIVGTIGVVAVNAIAILSRCHPLRWSVCECFEIRWW